MAGRCPGAVPAKELGDHSYFAYIYIKGIDEYFAQLQTRQACILKPLKDEPWGMREFASETIDGHRVMFGMNVEQQDRG